jgi:hypothetical protein
MTSRLLDFLAIFGNTTNFGTLPLRPRGQRFIA